MILPLPGDGWTEGHQAMYGEGYEAYEVNGQGRSLLRVNDVSFRQGNRHGASESHRRCPHRANNSILIISSSLFLDFGLVCHVPASVMEGLISHGHLRGKTVSSRDRSSSVEAVFVPRITSTHQESSTSKSKKNKMPSSAPRTPGDERGGPSKPQTWKDKPGMAKKRKRANVRPGWEMIEVDDDDEDVISSGRDVVSGPRPSTSGLKSKSNGESSRRPAVYEVDSSSQGGSSSESAQETDEDDYGMAKSQSSRGKNSKKKGKQVERRKSPVSKKQKGKQGKAGKAVKKRALSQDPEIQEIALSSLDNSVFVIGMSIASRPQPSTDMSR